MDIGSVNRPAGPSSVHAPQRADALVSSGAVKTDLPAEAAVQQVQEAAAVRFEPHDGVQARATLDEAMRDAIRRRIVVDQKNREVIHQTVDERTGEVIRQIPEKALLRLRAYARAAHAATESLSGPESSGLVV